MTLSADDYAVPEKRALRIHDASAVRFAWDHVHATKGLTEDERKEARRRIRERAQQLELNTDEWDAGKLHPVPDGKFVKVACVHKSVPRIIN